MKDIAFTQYLRPNGRKETINFEAPDDLAELAEKIVAAGYKLTAEVLTTNQVSLAIEGKNCDVDIRICGNGPMVPAAVEDLIRKFDFDKAKKLDDAAG